MTVQVGTSGFHYKHWRNRFYPQDLPSSKWLDYYCRHFGSVEINNSFYRLPEAKTLQTWRETTPEQFVFAVKGSRFLTHMKKLKDPEPGIERFFERIFTLEPKLGPVLFQLPPFWEKNAERLEVFLRALPQGLRYSFEFRNPTWHVPEIYGILQAHNAAFCPFDLGGFQSPIEITADWTYIRLHGPGGKYQGSYSDEALGSWARRIEDWRRNLRAVYFYFDNDMEGYAAANAATLQRMVKAGSPA